MLVPSIPDSSMLDWSRSTTSSWCRMLLKTSTGLSSIHVLHDGEERVEQDVWSAVTERHG